MVLSVCLPVGYRRGLGRAVLAEHETTPHPSRFPGLPIGPEAADLLQGMLTASFCKNADQNALAAVRSLEDNFTYNLSEYYIRAAGGRDTWSARLCLRRQFWV